jgi:hypothetical protein
MPIPYYPGDPAKRRLPAWYIDDMSNMDDFEEMIFEAGPKQFYRFTVSGKPTRISPRWKAKHKNWQEKGYEYAASYSIYREELAWMLDESSNPIEAFNAYLEDKGAGWIDITEIKLVDD